MTTSPNPTAISAAAIAMIKSAKISPCKSLRYEATATNPILTLLSRISVEKNSIIILRRLNMPKNPIQKHIADKIK